MTETSNNEERNTDLHLAQLLEAAGPREALPGDLRDRWETHFRSELLIARRARRRRLMLPIGALAASIVALALLVGRPVGTEAVAIPMQILAVSGDAAVQPANSAATAAVPQQTLTNATVLETGADGRLGLNWAGFDVRLNEHTRLHLLNDRLHLETGELFVSNRDRHTRIASATVVTAHATISDIGTQFKVRYDAGRVFASVREGSVVIETAQGRHQADAAAGLGRSLQVNTDGGVEVSADNSDWTWIYPVSQPFALEGRTVLEFLRWSTAESGHELRFTDEATELAAGFTRFSGTVDLTGVDPERAVGLVLSTTRFAAAHGNGTLLISRNSE